MRITSLILLFLCSIYAFGNSISEVDDLHKRIYPLLKTEKDSALSMAEEALEMSERIGYEWGIANSYYIQGYVYHLNNELSVAILKYLKSSNILKYKHDKRSMVNYIQIQMNCGNILRKHGKYDEALSFYDGALLSAESLGSTKERLDILFNKSLLYMDSKDYKVAIDVLNEAKKIATELKDHRLLVDCIMTIGIINQKLSNYDKAKLFFDQAINYKEISPNLLSLAWLNLGEVYELENDYDSAQYCFKNALIPVEQIKTPSDQYKRLFEANLFLARLNLTNSHFEEGITYGKEAVSVYERVDLIPEHYLVFKVLSDLNHKKGDDNESYNYMSRYYEENSKFQEHQEEIMKLRDKFKIDILLAGFYSEVDKENSTSMYQMIIGFLIIGIVLWVGVSRFRVNVVRKQLEKEIQQINKDSLV